MKRLMFSIIIIAPIFIAGCEKNTITYEFEATVLGQGLDCGDTYLIDMRNISGSQEITDTIYYADNLPEELKVRGLEIQLNCGYPNNDIIYVCTTMGPAFPHVFVSSSTLRE